MKRLQISKLFVKISKLFNQLFTLNFVFVEFINHVRYEIDEHSKNNCECENIVEKKNEFRFENTIRQFRNNVLIIFVLFDKFTSH